MSHSPLSSGFLLVGTNGLPVVEQSKQGKYALIFLERKDADRYRQQLSEIRRVSPKEFSVSAMPIHQIQRLLSYSQVKVCIINSWDSIVA